MNNNERARDELNELSKAITNALINSNEVLNILFDFKRQNMIDPSARLAFIINVNDLINMAEKLLENSSTEAQAKSEYIDGRRLTEKEIAFEEYLANRFDEMGWLKKHGIIFK